MKILVLSNSAWDDSNSFGSTFSNFFQGFEKDDIASISCSGGTPNTNTCGRFFKISEGALLKTIKGKAREAGEEAFVTSGDNVEKTKEKKSVSFAKKHRWTIFFWMRELLWKWGKWKGEKLDNFVESFQPDILVLPTYSYSYINKLALYIQKKWNLPMVSYVSDDEYTLKQFSLSPFYWINRLYQRKWVKKGIENSKMLYCISTLQKEEYEKCFSTPCKVMTKFFSFDAVADVKTSKTPIRFLYTGNIGDNRWRSLAILADGLKSINKTQTLATLEIYTATPTTKKMQKKLNVDGCCKIMGKVSANEVKALQKEADVLVHVEARDIKNRLRVRQSFSTKLVDYFKASRAIFAIGPKNVASIKHLLDNNCAIVATDKKEVVEKLTEIIRQPALLSVLGEQAYQCGKTHHSKEVLQAEWIKDLKEFCGE